MPGTGRMRLLGAALGALALGACGMAGNDPAMRDAAALTGGDPQAGREKIRTYGCNTCHTVPGVPGAHGRVGPPLTGIGERMYVAGVLTNTPENMVKWIVDPTGVDSATAMPNTGVTERDARDIAAYLYSLR